MESCDLPCDNKVTKSNKLTDEEIEILEFRFGFSMKFLCEQHYNDQFSRYKGWHNKCSDPLNIHAKTVKASLREIQLDFAKNVKRYTESRVVPGQKICINCVKKLRELVREGEERAGEERAGEEQGVEEAGGPLLADSPSMELDSPR